MSHTEILAAGDPARAAQTFHDGGPVAARPVCAPAALAMLPALHHEAGRDLYLRRQLASTPQFCIALMLASAAVLVWGAQASLAAEFTWATAVFLGVAALAHNHIRGFACSPRQVAVTQTVRELRLILLYLGFAWGSGAFLVLPQAPASILVLAFVAVPGLAAATMLKDEFGVIAFGLPVALLTAGAACLTQASRPWIAGAILLTGVSIAGFSMLHCANQRRAQDLH
jgi:hypothetical protein